MFKMFVVDHVAIWTSQCDTMLSELVGRTGSRVLEGYRPGGVVVAKGVRFANGSFLDVHQFEGAVPEGGSLPRLLALRGSLDAAEQLAAAQDWRVRASRRDKAPDSSLEPPWSLLSFRRGQGVLSLLFFIDYAVGAVTPDDYQGALYDPHLAAEGPTRLAEVRIQVSDPAVEAARLAPLGEFVRSTSQDRRIRIGDVDIVLSPGPEGDDPRITGIGLADPRNLPHLIASADDFEISVTSVYT
jgi:hypothetical protein